MQHDPKAMKAKATKMLKAGSISEKEHKRLHAKADAELARIKAQPKSEAAEDDTAGGGVTKPAKDAKIKNGIGKLSATGGKEAPMDGDDSPEADNPSGKYRKRGSDIVNRGQVLDEEYRDL